MLLVENGIQLPGGTKNWKSARINCHEDLDGFFSGLLIYNQLVKQGIPGNRININFVQYGQNDLVDKATRKNKHQAVLTGDFAAYPKVDMESSFNGIAKSIDSVNNKFVYPAKGNDYQAFKSAVMLKNKPSFKLLSDWMKVHNPNAIFFTKSKDSSVRKSYNDFLLGWKKYNGDDKVSVTDSDFTSDHHSNDKGDLVPGKFGKIGATNFRSDTEHLATVNAQGLMGWDDLEAISRVDSATYHNLHDTLTMPGKFHGKDRKERLAILVSALVTSIIKSNPRLAVELIKSSQPSLVSVYNNALRISKLNDNELEILKLLKEENVDWNRVNELVKTLPASEGKKILQQRDENKSIKPVSSVEQMRAKNEKNIEREVKENESDFTFYGNISVFKSKNTRDQPGRYLPFFLTHNGNKVAFSIRNFGSFGMIQVSASPFMSEKDKKTIDLSPICLDALDIAKEKGLISENQFKVIKESSGGHKSIYNVSNVSIVPNTELKPNERYELKDKEDYEARRKKLNNKAVKKALDKGYDKRILELKNQKVEARDKVVNFLIDRIIEGLKRKYSNIEVNPTHTYEVK